jgi:hypothetical protein
MCGQELITLTALSGELTKFNGDGNLGFMVDSLRELLKSLVYAEEISQAAIEDTMAEYTRHIVDHVTHKAAIKLKPQISHRSLVSAIGSDLCGHVRWSQKLWISYEGVQDLSPLDHEVAVQKYPSGRIGFWIDQLRSFLREQNQLGLDKAKWEFTWLKLLQNIISYHSRTLRSLTLHMSESRSPKMNRQVAEILSIFELWSNWFVAGKSHERFFGKYD